MQTTHARGAIYRDGEVIGLSLVGRLFRVRRVGDGFTYRLANSSDVFVTQRHASEPDLLFLLDAKATGYRPNPLGRVWLTDDDRRGPLRVSDRQPAPRRGVQPFTTGSVR